MRRDESAGSFPFNPLQALMKMGQGMEQSPVAKELTPAAKSVALANCELMGCGAGGRGPIGR